MFDVLIINNYYPYYYSLFICIIDTNKEKFWREIGEKSEIKNFKKLKKFNFFINRAHFSLSLLADFYKNILFSLLSGNKISFFRISIYFIFDCKEINLYFL